MNDFLFLEQIFQELTKIHKTTNYSTTSRGSTPISMTMVGNHKRNIDTKFQANPSSGLREVKCVILFIAIHCSFKS